MSSAIYLMGQSVTKTTEDNENISSVSVLSKFLWLNRRWTQIIPPFSKTAVHGHHRNLCGFVKANAICLLVGFNPAYLC